MKKIVSILLSLALALSLGAGVLAADAVPGDARAVIADGLNDEQVAQVYNMFGATRGSVPELTVTNADERQYLSGLVDEAVIGSNAISCVYIEILPAGDGLQIDTRNLSWCTTDMFINALVTAGIDDAKIVVAAPFEVSGTAALTGIYKAYEDMTGQSMDEVAKLVSTQELVITSQLADEIGNYDAVTIVNELKLILADTVNMTDEELCAQIRAIAQEYGVQLNDSEMNQLVSLCRALEKMDSAQLKEKVEYVQDTVQKLAQAQEKVSGITRTVKNVVNSISSFISNVVNFFKAGA